jgi:hypothetical protein
MSVPSAIVGGAVLAIRSRSLTFGLSKVVRETKGARFDTKAPRPVVDPGGSVEREPPFEPPPVAEARPVMVETSLELPDAEPGVIKPGTKASCRGFCCRGYASWYNVAGRRGRM